ncbi:MAG: hypothetical protein WCM76_14330 [Bacteroidota bacterium]
MRAFIAIIIISIFCCFQTNAQDTVRFLNGRCISGKVVSNSNETIIHLTKSHKTHSKTKKYFKEDVFDIRYGTGSKEVLYLADSNRGNYFSEDEMDRYISGMQNARINYKAPWVTVGGFAAGAAGLYWGFWGLAAPAAYAVTFSVIPVKTKGKPYLKDHIGDEYYIEGFNAMAHRKKVKNALLGGIGGALLVGITTAILTFKFAND